MTVIQRLVFRYISQFVFVLFVIIVALITSTLLIGFTLLEQESGNDISTLSSDYLEVAISIEDDEVEVRDSLLEGLDSQDAWLQIVSEDGTVLFNHDVPEEVPTSYSTPDFASLYDTAGPSTRLLALKFEDKPYIAVLGKSEKIRDLLTRIEDTSFTNMTEEDQKVAKELQANLYVYNETTLVDSFETTEKVNQPTLHELVDFQATNVDRTEEIVTYYNPETQLTYIGVRPNEKMTGTTQAMNTTILSTFSMTMLVILGLLLALAVWYAIRLGRPVIHIIRWLQLLAEDELQEPIDKKGKPVSTKKNGKLRKPFKPFKEVLESLSKLTHTLQHNKLQQQKTEETREEWITGLSHDLKTPLSAIYGYSVMMNNPEYEWSRHEVNEFTEVIERNSLYMSGLIEDLTLTYRIKNDGLPVFLETLEMVSTVQTITESFMSTHLKEEQTYSMELPKEPFEYDMDLNHFTRILQNLLGNAIKYNPEGTKIQIHLTKRTDSFQLVIQDNGVGMTEETRQRLFDRYYRGTGVSDTTLGTGLGLAITKQLIELHSGTIEVHSQVDKGTTIEVIFPWKSYIYKKLS